MARNSGLCNTGQVCGEGQRLLGPLPNLPGAGRGRGAGGGGQGTTPPPGSWPLPGKEVPAGGGQEQRARAGLQDAGTCSFLPAYPGLCISRTRWALRRCLLSARRALPHTHGARSDHDPRDGTEPSLRHADPVLQRDQDGSGAPVFPGRGAVWAGP